MPVRQIPKNYMTVTGRVARGDDGEAAGFEGILEKDYLLLLKHDDAVRDFEVQPVRVPVRGARPYTPDVLVHFFDDAQGRSRPSELTEVKPKARFLKGEIKFAARFTAADLFASARGWIFVKKDESHIAGPKLQNIKFLRNYMRNQLPAEERARVMAAVGRLKGKTTSEELLSMLCVTDDERLATVPVLWQLVFTGFLAIDMDVPIPRNVPLWIASR